MRDTLTYLHKTKREHIDGTADSFQTDNSNIAEIEPEIYHTEVGF